MNPVRPALALFFVLGAAMAQAAASFPTALTIPNAYDCRQTFASYGPTGIPSWVVADRGVLTFNVDKDTYKPTSYDYDAFFLTDQARAGGWSWDGTVTFDNGPLARPDEGWSIQGQWLGAHRVAMPHDNIRGRIWPLAMRSLKADPAAEAPAVDGLEGKDGYQRSYWYCGPFGAAPRQVFGKKAIGYVAKASGLKVKLPTWVEQASQDGKPGVRGHIRVARKGLYRLEFFDRSCTKGCQSVAIFSAKRDSASELGHRTPITLPGGIRGFVGSVGCSAGDGHDWGPVYCGRSVVVWHAKGINYAIEAPQADDSDLVRYARQTVLYG